MVQPMMTKVVGVATSPLTSPNIASQVMEKAKEQIPGFVAGAAVGAVAATYLTKKKVRRTATRIKRQIELLALKIKRAQLTRRLFRESLRPI